MAAGLLAVVGMCASYLPILRYYDRHWLWVLSLPAAAETHLDIVTFGGTSNLPIWVAKDKGLQLVLPKAVAFVADDSLNVTADVIKELNDNYKSAAPAPAAPSGDKPAAK